MFYVEWEPKNNGVVLKLESSFSSLAITPRPVFWEELDLLGLADKWEYPRVQEPLCWACGRKYYYRGELVMETKGGNMYDSPIVQIVNNAYNIKLVPVDLEKLFSTNKEFLHFLEYEAIQFFVDTFNKYSEHINKGATSISNEIDWERLRCIQEQIENTPMAVVKQTCGSFDIVAMETAHQEGKNVVSGSKVEEVIVSFSGGKDSQVVLDLATRALSPSYFSVVYSDTGYELPSSLELYKQTQEFYNKKYPDLRFDLTKNQQDIMYYWENMGAPSRMHRWCCSVMKTAPLYRYLKNRAGREKQPKVLVFEGVRGEESPRRSEYMRIGSSVKHKGVINARPIFSWNNTEVYLYILRRQLPFNRAYRDGLSRVGCILCPYSTGWSEHIVMKNYPEAMAPFVSHLESTCKEIGVSDVDNYIKHGQWKMRGGGKVLLNQSSSIEVLSKGVDLELLLVNPKEDFFEWLKVLGTYTTRTEGAVVFGEIFRKKGKNEIIQPFRFERISSDNYKVTFFSLPSKPDFQSLVLKVVNKITYCVHCEACEVECPTGALKVTPIVSIDSTKCIHCLRCVEFKDKGCMMAKSLSDNLFNKTTKTKKMNLDRYYTFGLQQEWLKSYMSQLSTFFVSEHGLNPKKQIPALKNWLREALLLNQRDLTSTELAQFLCDIRIYPDQQKVLWEIIWFNLANNSPVCKTFVNLISAGEGITKKDLIAKIVEEIGATSERTVKNAVDSLVNLFTKSYLTNIKLVSVDVISRSETILRRHDYIPSPITFAYAIYYFSQKHEEHFLTVNDLVSGRFDDDFSKIFGLDATSIEPLLRILQNSFGLADIQLSMGLDNVILNKGMTSLEALKQAL